MRDSLDYECSSKAGTAWLGTVRVERYAPHKVLYLPAEASIGTIEKLLATVERACAPLPREEIGKRLAQLMVYTKARARDEDETHLTLALYAEKLADYPADAVVFALKEWPEHNTFFPAWNELKRLTLAHCWSRLRVRDRLREVLQYRKSLA